MSLDVIVSKVRERPELWQSNHPYARNRSAQLKIWLEIAKDINVDVVLIKKRWKHLKDQYRKEIKKIRDAMGGIVPDGYVSSWCHYPKMTFLQDEILNGDSSRKYWNEPVSEEEAASDFEPLVPQPAIKKRKSENTDTNEAGSSKIDTLTKRLNHLETIIRSNQLSDTFQRSDPDYMFLVSLLPSMKRLSDIQKMYFRGKVNDWLLEVMAQNEFTTDPIDTKIYMHSEVQNQ